MSATGLVLSRPSWSRVSVGSHAVAVADRDALGTTARLAVWPASNLTRMLAAVDDELAALDGQASRFRVDSEISVLHAAGGGIHQVSTGLAEAIRTALAAAAWTGGRCDPTVGGALIRIGYDRDFAAIEPNGTPLSQDSGVSAGWQAVRLRGNELALPAGVLLDLGATAKGLGADRAAAAAYAMAGEGGVLVSLGGDLAVAGRPPAGGWPVLIADEHRQVRAARNLTRFGCRADQRAGNEPGGTADPGVAQQIRLSRGGLATSSTTCRRWVRAGRVMHHIIDPRTGIAGRRAVAHRHGGRRELRRSQRRSHGRDRGGRGRGQLAHRPRPACPADHPRRPDHQDLRLAGGGGRAHRPACCLLAGCHD